MDDTRFPSAERGTSTQSYSYSNIVHQQQQGNHHPLPSPQTPEMYGQYRPPLGGPLPSMGGPQHHPQPSQYPTQNTYQSHTSQQQYQYSQQPSPYSQNQQAFSQHPHPYQPMSAPPMMNPNHMMHAGQQVMVQPSTNYGQTAPQSPHASVAQSEDNTPVRIEDEDAFKRENPPPPPEDHWSNDKLWELRVVQEPKRARMCGYGDKDRRPITCPPIVQLKIKDPQTEEEIDYDNGNFTIGHFTCIAQLSGLQKGDDKSVLRAHPSQGIVSVATCNGWPAAIVPQHRDYVAPRVEPGQYPAAQYGQAGYSSNSNTQGRLPPIGRTPTWNGQHMNMSGPAPTPYGQAQPRPGLTLPQLPALPPHHPAAIRPQQPPTPPAEQSSNLSPGNVFQRNLIGQTSSSAQLLHDQNKKGGIYFIFSDLSVRTEDWFRLKFQVFNVAECLNGLSQDEIVRKAAENDAAPSNNPEGKRGSKSFEGIKNSLVGKTAPCLSTCWSDCFRVYSAKKFPGVADSTELSRCFAEQGVKISIRKDNSKDDADGKSGNKRKRNSIGSDGNQEEDYGE